MAACNRRNHTSTMVSPAFIPRARVGGSIDAALGWGQRCDRPADAPPSEHQAKPVVQRLQHNGRRLNVAIQRISGDL
jgi:hypothetical protein